MDPEEKQLLERTLKLVEENNKILHNVEARAKRAVIYSFLKFALILLPFILGYLFLEPYLDQAVSSYGEVRELFQSI